MPPKLALPAFNTKKRNVSMFDEINKLDENGIFQLIQELEVDHQLSREFRYHAVSTQRKQDSALSMYLKTIRQIKGLDASVDDDEVKMHAFPPDHQQLLKLLCAFMNVVFRYTQGRAGKIVYRTMVGYRQHLCYWSKRIYMLRNEVPPQPSMVYNAITTTMRFLSQTHGDEQPRDETPGIGIPEMRQLLDLEATTTSNIEMSEQHQFAWCLARVTALRPGSFGNARSNKTAFVRWRHVEFKADPTTKGAFQLVLEISVLKTQGKDLQLTSGHAHKRIKVHINSPAKENIMFSAPHRLLVIALRRKLLVGIETVQQLMNTNLQYIRIKPEHLDDPVLYSGSTGRNSLDYNKPLNGEQLTAYLGLRGRKLGYPKGIRFYDFRHRTATDLIPVIGVEATRIVMMHTPESRSLERYYLNSRARMDLTAATLGASTSGLAADAANSAVMTAQASDYATQALMHEPERLTRLRGHALNNLVDHIIAQDEDYPTGATQKELKAYRHRVRKLAWTHLRDQEIEDQKDTMTQQAYKDRLEQIHSASAFAKAVIDGAKSRLTTANVEPEEDPADAPDFDHEFPAPEDEFEPEDDLDLFAGNAADGADLEVVEPAEPETAEEPNQDVSYVDAATSLMVILMDNTLSEYLPWSARYKTCPKCALDETVDEEARQKEWLSSYHLQKHMNSTFHSAHRQVQRKLKLDASLRPDGRFRCPYCDIAGGIDGEDADEFEEVPDVKTYHNLTRLCEHIEESTAENTSQEHDEAKDADGWYDEDFYGTVQESTVKERIQKRRREMDEDDFEFTWYPSLAAPIPHPTNPLLVSGGHNAEQIHDRYRGFLIKGPPAEPFDASTLPGHTLYDPENPPMPLTDEQMGQMGLKRGSD